MTLLHFFGVTGLALIFVGVAALLVAKFYP